jgi:hypothetical protein
VTLYFRTALFAGTKVTKEQVNILPYDCEIGSFDVTERLLSDEQALIATFNMAHCRGGSEQCVSDNSLLWKSDIETFSAFHAVSLLSTGADVICCQEFAGVYDDVCFTEENIVKPILSKMQEISKESSWSAVTVCDDSRYWHPYAIFSKLPMSEFSQEEPKTCQVLLAQNIHCTTLSFVCLSFFTS